MRSAKMVGCHGDMAYCRACPERCFSYEALAEPEPEAPDSVGIPRYFSRRFWLSVWGGIGAAIGLKSVAK